MTLACPYCGNAAALVTGREVYPHRGDRDLIEKPFWACLPCGAWVGCHPGTTSPLGRLANAELRKAKMAAHAAFDPFWKAKMRRDGVPKKKARGLAYKWLAGQLGIAREDCHVGMMDVETCRRVVEVCNGFRNRRVVA
ncbi:zinc-finger-containing protein [Xanthobacteraceae bacterium Astr-EGSB]|uniref:zinc-finger-containing protein n=1 Tax=Astrobacterium formosum TaxID=3069710 RepID=UPI0027B51CC3|nr:zinc-finger-containing protein [Xanthobacteraceae bacterium Astr-EGSB]